MAFVDFAKLDSNGLVLDVTVLDAESIKKDGVVDEDLGIGKCLIKTCLEMFTLKVEQN